MIEAVVRLPDAAVTVQAAPPELVSQRTCLDVLGIPRRTYLDSLPAFRGSGHDVLTLGRLRLVDRADYVAWLRVQSAGATHADDGADELAVRRRELGLVRDRGAA